MIPPSRSTQTWRHRLLRLSITGGVSLLLAAGGLAVPRLDASAAVSLSQCNGGDGAGSAIACDVTVINNLNGAVTSSTVTVRRACAGTNVNCGPTPGVTTTSNQLVTEIRQCNNAGNGGGSTLTCTVRITNNIVGSATTTPSTVNQCNGSGDGLGAPTVVCNPFPARTTGADFTQCNGSANGGTLVGLNCSVSSGARTAAALRVTVDQCNLSDNGGGSKVTCSVTISNNITQRSAPGGGTPSRSRTPRRQGITGGVPPVPDTGAAPAWPLGGASLLLLGVGVLRVGIRRPRSVEPTRT